MENAKVDSKLTNDNGWDALIFTVMGSSISLVCGHVMAGKIEKSNDEDHL